MTIDITGVTKDPAFVDSYLVKGEVGTRRRHVSVAGSELADVIGNDPANYSLQDLVPAIVTIAFPRLVQAFKS